VLFRSQWGTDQDPSSPASIQVDPNQALLQSVHFTWKKDDPATGMLVLNQASGPVVTVPFQVVEVVSAWVLLEALGVAVVMAIVIMLLVERRLRKPTPPRPELEPGPTWTFKDSWATNATAMGAILGTVLAATGFLTEIMPGLSTGMFAGFALLYLFLVLAAPVVFQAFYKDNKPTYRGLLLAGGVVVAAVIGEITTTAILIVRGGVPLWIALAVLGVVVVGMYFYSLASIRLAVADPEPDGVEPNGAATAAAAVAAGLAAWRRWPVDEASGAAETAERAILAMHRESKGEESSGEEPSFSVARPTTRSAPALL
jgi:hypothetical protein